MTDFNRPEGYYFNHEGQSVALADGDAVIEELASRMEHGKIERGDHIEIIALERVDKQA